MATTDATTEAPETGQGTKSGKKTKKKRAKRTRKQLPYILGWLNETEAEKDEEGNEIPGTSRKVFVVMELPPGLDDAGKRSREAIERACKRAVYELGMEEYGNKKFSVLQVGDEFDVPYERTTITQLLPPDKAEKARAQNGKGVQVTTDSDDGEGAEDVEV